MKQETLFTLDTPYRQSLDAEGFRFGKGEKACAIVGGLRGNEVQQMYVCTQLIQTLKRLEHQGAINNGKEILVVPCVNHLSMNVGSRFWPMDNTDINRMFPGYERGETTQRIAWSLFEQVRDYSYGIHLASFYMPGDFVPHVRIMHTGYENASLANLFGLPFVVVREPQPFDTTTLNYNWQLWGTSAFSVYTKDTDAIDIASAEMAVSAVLRFLSRVGVLKYSCHCGYHSEMLKENTLCNVKSDQGGMFRRLKHPGESVEYGEIMGEILDPFTGEIKSELKASTTGTIFFAVKKPLITQNTIAFRIIHRLRF